MLRQRSRGDSRLDQPARSRTFRASTSDIYDSERFGRAAERIARFFGTTRYLVIQTVLVIVWITANVLLTRHYLADNPGCDSTGRSTTASAECGSGRPFDPYPFILLNLAFSTQAAYAAPLILLAQNRQEKRDRDQAAFDRQRFERNLADTEFLMRELAQLRLGQEGVATAEQLDRVNERLAALSEQLSADLARTGPEETSS